MEPCRLEKTEISRNLVSYDFYLAGFIIVRNPYDLSIPAQSREAGPIEAERERSYPFDGGKGMGVNRRWVVEKLGDPLFNLLSLRYRQFDGMRLIHRPAIPPIRVQAPKVPLSDASDGRINRRDPHHDLVYARWRLDDDRHITYSIFGPDAESTVSSRPARSSHDPIGHRTADPAHPRA
jgi:hypothetical protein